MTRLSRSLGCALAATLMSVLLPASNCQLEAPTDESFIQGLLSNDSRIQRLAAGQAVNGTLPYLYYELLGFSVPKRSDEGLGFPDVLLSLEVSNSAGDVDVFCHPYVEGEDGKFRVPLPFNGQHTWASNHSQGADYLFISHRHSSYQLGSREDGNRTLTDFICSLWGLSRTASQYRLEVDVDYSPRSLAREERQAVRSLYSKCCGADGGCEQWHRMERLMIGANASDRAPPLDLCHVVGNVCDEEGRLIKLNMQGFGLECEFPAKEVAALSRLEKVDLSHNRLSGDIGEISGELQKLENLDHLSAVGNNISGSLNDARVCNLVSNGLETMDMDDNALTGPLPACLFDDDSTLKEIDLDGNDLGSFLPPAFALDSKLEVLSLADANLTGALPESMGNLQRLRVLSLGYNDLMGSVPVDIGVSRFLTTVSLPNNRLEGAVPGSLATNPSLLTLVLSNNSFSKLADEWYQPGVVGPNLDEFSFKENVVKGFLPAALFTSNVTVLDLSYNEFDGPLPVLDDMLPKAWFIGLTNNSISGPIPEEWAGIGFFSGTALEDFFGVPLLDLRNNKLSGSIPRFLLNSTGLSNRTLQTSGIFLNGNDFECVKLGPLETSQHLRGVSECTEEVEGEPGAAPRATSVDSGDVNVRFAVDDDRYPGTDVSSVESSDGSMTAAIAAVSVAVIGGVVAVVLAAAMIFFVVKKRRRTRPAHSGGDIEGGKGVHLSFERYSDEGTEVAVSAL